MKYIAKLDNFINLLKQIASLVQEAPDTVLQFINLIEQNHESLITEVILTSNLIPFTIHLLQNNTEEMPICLILKMYIKLARFEIDTLQYMVKYGVLSVISQFYEHPSFNVCSLIATFFLKIIGHSDLPPKIQIKVYEAFFNQAYQWSAGFCDEKCQILCLKFIILTFYNMESIENIFSISEENYFTLISLFFELAQHQTIEIASLAFHCISRLTIVTGTIKFNETEALQLCMVTLKEEYNKELAFYVVELIATISVVKPDLDIFLNVVDLKYLFDLLLNPISSVNTRYFISIILQNIAHSGPSSIEYLLNSGFIEVAKRFFDTGNMKSIDVICACFKEIFFLANPDVLINVFRSGILIPLLTIFESSLNEMTAPVIYSMCCGIEKCAQTYGSGAIQEISNLFRIGGAFEILLNISEMECDDAKIIEKVEDLIQMLGGLDHQG